MTTQPDRSLFSPGPEPTPDVKLVRVLTTGDAGLIAVAKSLLEGEEIDYLIRGDGLQDLEGLSASDGAGHPSPDA